MHDIVIRKGKKSDLPVLKRLLVELINAMDDTACIDMRVAPKHWEQLFRDARSHFLVATAGGTPVGLIHLTIRQTVLHRSPSGMIDELIVTNEYQGKGIGKQLVLAAIDRCRQLGCCEVEVSTEQTNLKARRFYRKCGFVKEEILFELDL